jgi:hypothetical protein
MKAEKPTFANTSDITRKSRGEGCKGKEATHKSAISSAKQNLRPQPLLLHCLEISFVCRWAKNFRMSRCHLMMQVSIVAFSPISKREVAAENELLQGFSTRQGESWMCWMSHDESASDHQSRHR